MVDEAVAADIRREIDREQKLLLLQNVRASTLPTILVGAIYAAFFTRFAAVPQTWIWWLAIVAVMGLRWWIARPPASDGDPILAVPTWLFYVLMLATGVLWGIAPALIAWLGDDVMMFTTLLFTTGIGIAAFGSYGISLYAVLAVTAPIAALSLAVIAASGNPAYYAVGIALLLLYAHQFIVIRQGRQVLENQIRLRLENAVLAAQQGAENEKTAAELDRRMEMERQLRASKDRAEKMSATDALTEIANRRYFDNRLKSEVSRAFRDRTKSFAGDQRYRLLQAVQRPIRPPRRRRMPEIVCPNSRILLPSRRRFGGTCRWRGIRLVTALDRSPRRAKTGGERTRRL